MYCANNPVIFVDPDGRDVRISIQDETITLKLNIILTGELATDKLASIYKQDIMSSWGQQKKYSYGDKEYNLVWDVDVRVALPDERKSFDGINNYMEAVDNEGQSYVMNTNHGEIRAGESKDGVPLEMSNPMSHEFGHLLGLKDKYFREGENKGLAFSGWMYNVMGSKSGFGVVENKNMKILLDRPVRLHNFLKTHVYIPGTLNISNHYIDAKNREK